MANFGSHIPLFQKNRKFNLIQVVFNQFQNQHKIFMKTLRKFYIKFIEILGEEFKDCKDEMIQRLTKSPKFWGQSL